MNISRLTSISRILEDSLEDLKSDYKIFVKITESKMKQLCTRKGDLLISIDVIQKKTMKRESTVLSIEKVFLDNATDSGCALIAYDDIIDFIEEKFVYGKTDIDSKQKTSVTIEFEV